MKREEIISRINELRRKRGAVILAHNYELGEIQDIADYQGDSLELSIRAAETDASEIVFCGVRFMAETAKILSPDSTVVMVRSDAGCPMADMVDPEELKAYKAANPDTLLIAYVNTTAEVKSLVDICCTSGNAEKIVSSIPADRKIMFLPDRNLGANLINKLQRPMELWHGCCPVHDAVTVEMINDARKKYPNSQILVHPECRPEVVNAADQALSTGAMLNFVTASTHDEFTVGTESGIMFRMMLANPDKKFHLLQPEILCTDMKKLTLADVEKALRTGKDEVILSQDILKSAEGAIRRMLDVK